MTGTKMFDLAAVKMADSAELAIADPTTGEPTGFVLTIANPYSAAAKGIQRKLFDRAMAEGQKGRKVKRTFEDVERFSVDSLVAITIGWTGLHSDGKEVPYSPDAARSLYEAEGLGWLRDEVQAFYEDRNSFFGKSNAS
jgi:hypothetical protein